MRKENNLYISKLSEQLLSQAKLESELHEQLASITSYLQRISSLLDSIQRAGNEINFDELAFKQHFDALLKRISDVQTLSSRLEGKESGLKDGMQKISDFLNRFGIDASMVDEILNVIDDNLKILSDGLSSLQQQYDQLVQRIEHEHKSAVNFSEAVNKIKNQNENIKKIFHVIDEIVSKTDLLAINTAIIADKSSAKSDGLKVVAKEMQILAEQSKYSTEELAKTMSSFMSDVSEIEVLLNQSIYSYEENLSITKSHVDYFERSNVAAKNLAAEVAKLKSKIHEGKKSVLTQQELLRGFNSDIEVVGKASEGVNSVLDETALQSQKILDILQLNQKLLEQHSQLIKQTINESLSAIGLASQSMSKCGQLSQNALVFESLLHELSDGQEPQA